jgi:hypothetical protein
MASSNELSHIIDAREREKDSRLGYLDLEIARLKKVDRFGHKIVSLISVRNELAESMNLTFKCSSCGKLLRDCCYKSLDVCTQMNK